MTWAIKPMALYNSCIFDYNEMVVPKNVVDWNREIENTDEIE